MVWYAMLCYPMLWYGMESMVCYEISMLCYEISMQCYAMVYVVKDKHSATVHVLANCRTYRKALDPLTVQTIQLIKQCNLFLSNNLFPEHVVLWNKKVRAFSSVNP